MDRARGGGGGGGGSSRGNSGKRTPTWTHFVSLPLAASPTQRPELFEAHQRFVQRVSALPLFRRTLPTSLAAGTLGSAAGSLDASLFTPPQALHMTVLMLALPRAEDVARAQAALAELPARVFARYCPPDQTPEERQRLFTVHLCGLRTFAAAPGARSGTRVVFCQPQPLSPQLVPLLNDVRAHFHACGLTTSYPRERDLTLHLTLLNARHRRLADGTHPPDLVPFDAHPITSRSELRNTDLGVVHIDQVRIDIMGAGPDGYTPIAAVNTP